MRRQEWAENIKEKQEGEKESVEKYLGLSFNEAEYLAEMKIKATITANVPPDIGN